MGGGVGSGGLWGWCVAIRVEGFGCPPSHPQHHRAQASDSPRAAAEKTPCRWSSPQSRPCQRRPRPSFRAAWRTASRTGGTCSRQPPTRTCSSSGEAVAGVAPAVATLGRRLGTAFTELFPGRSARPGAACLSLTGRKSGDAPRVCRPLSLAPPLRARPQAHAKRFLLGLAAVAGGGGGGWATAMQRTRAAGGCVLLQMWPCTEMPHCRRPDVSQYCV